jgi:Zn-dependent M32 family carboxypeptidase
VLARANDLPEDLNETMDTLLQLRTEVRDRLSGVMKDLDAILGYFKGYEEDQRQRGGVLLSKGISFFEGILRFDAGKVIQAVEEEIEALQAKIETAKTKKSEELQMKLLPIIDELMKLQFVNQTLAQR